MDSFRMHRFTYDFPLRDSKRVRLVRDEEHGDWKTAVARGIKGVKKGQVATLTHVFRTLYGMYGRIEFDGRSIEVPTSSLEEVP